MIYSIRNKDEIEDLNELEDLKSKVKQVRLVENLDKQGFHNDIKQLYEPITKAVTDINQNLFEETKSKTKAIEELDDLSVHLKTFQLMNKNGVIDSSFIRPISKFLVPESKSHFRLKDDTDSDDWNDYTMRGEKFTIYDDKLVFKNSGKIFTLRSDVLKMIINYKLKTTDSPDAKLVILIMDEMYFDIPSLGKSLRDRNLIKNCIKKRAILVSGFKTISFQRILKNFVIN